MRFVMESMVNVHRFCDKLLSTSAWGSELKLESGPKRPVENGLPLREVVSWNIKKIAAYVKKYASTSAWGSELKYFCSAV